MRKIFILLPLGILISSCAPALFEEYDLQEKMVIQQESLSSCLKLKDNLNRELKKLNFLDYGSEEYVVSLTEANSWSDLYYKTCNGVTFNN